MGLPIAIYYLQSIARKNEPLPPFRSCFSCFAITLASHAIGARVIHRDAMENILANHLSE